MADSGVGRCSNEKEIATVHAAGPEDVDAAVSAARQAFRDPSWRDLSATGRGELLLKFAQLVERDAETMATIETWDNGIRRSTCRPRYMRPERPSC